MEWNLFPDRRVETSVTDCRICRRRVMNLIAAIGFERALNPSQDRSLPTIFGVDRITTGQGDPIGGEVEETWLADAQVIHYALRPYLCYHAPKLLGFECEGGFFRYLPFLFDRLGKFFSETSHAPAWLDVLPARESSTVRFKKANAGFEQKTLSSLPKFRDRDVYFPISFGDRMQDLRIRNLSWGYVPDKEAPSLPVTTRVQRRLTKFGIDYMETWAFLASPDDLKQLRENRIPASACRGRGGLAGTTLLNAVTFKGNTQAEAEARILVFEFCKTSADLLSIRYIVTPFATIEAMSPMQTLTLNRVLKKLV